jgi:osmotically-inducible protein OsmY
VAVEANDGHVVLRGRARTDEARREADKIARRIKGVLSVQNGLDTDRVLRTRVEGRLQDDAIAGLYPVDVEATDGVVTVGGEVPNSAVKGIVLGLVEDTPGVELVVDRVHERPERFDGAQPVGRMQREP